MKRCAIALAFVVMPVMGWAQGEQKPAPPPPSTYDKIWNGLTNWYLSLIHI